MIRAHLFIQEAWEKGPKSVRAELHDQSRGCQRARIVATPEVHVSRTMLRRLEGSDCWWLIACEMPADGLRILRAGKADDHRILARGGMRIVSR